MSRREFIKCGTGGLVITGLCLAGGEVLAARPDAAKYPVGIARDEAAVAAVAEALGLLGGIGRFVKPGETLIIKPNNVTSRYLPGSVTSAEVVAALAQQVLQAGGKPVIAENDLEYAPAAKNFAESCGKHYFDALAALGLAAKVPLVNLSKDEQVPVSLPEARVLKKTLVARTVLAADGIIDVPVMKTHDQTQVTLGIKNLKGCLPLKERRRSHSLGVEQAIVDLCAFLKPRLVVVDGMTAAEGIGPVGGTPVRMNLVLAGANPLAVDMVGAHVMGFAVGDIKFLRHAIAAGLGPRSLEDIEVLGLPMEQVRRKFLTAMAVVLRQYQEMGIRVIDKNVCSGCWAEFRHVYYSFGPQRSKLKGLTFVLGQVTELPPTEKAIILGRCAKAVAAGGEFLPGCPPHHTAIERAAARLAGIDLSKIDTYGG